MGSEAKKTTEPHCNRRTIDRKNPPAARLTFETRAQTQKAAPPASADAAASGRKPNIPVIFGDSIGQANVSACS